MTVRLENSKQVESMLSKYDTVLFDCDGVLWAGNELFPNTKETLEYLISLGKKLLFVSNNSAKTPDMYLDKIPVKDESVVNKDSVVTSSIATAIYVKNVLKLSTEDKIHVLGGPGVVHALEAQGYKVTMDGDDPKVTAVVAGLDFSLTYDKLATTLQYLLNPKILFIATNIDSTFPINGTKYPGAGSIIELLKFASSRQPDAICGKPHKAMMQAIVTKHHLNNSKTLMVGDRLNTDMKFGHDNGIDTLLVETGIDKLGDASNDNVTFVSSSLADLYTITHK